MQLLSEDSIGFLLHRTNMQAKNELLKALRPHNLTPEQWGVLNRLAAEEGITQKELAKKTCKDQPTTTRILAKMEAKGLVRREADRDDARASRVFLTDKGKSLRVRVLPLVKEVLNRALEGLSDEEVIKLKMILNKIYANLGGE